MPLPTLIRVGFIVSLWTLSFGLMVVRTVDYDNMALSPLTGWSLLTAMCASVVTGWQIVLCERHRVCDIARLAAAAALSGDGLRSVD